jgi:hypothetical protein
MSFLETLKEVAGSVVEAIQENPVAAGVGTAVVAAGVGGTVWYRRRKAKKAVNVRQVMGELEAAAAAGNPALAAAHAAAVDATKSAA